MSVFCMTGASGTGKSTLLKYIKDNFNMEVSEVSARPYLPKDQDYVSGSNDSNQILIAENRFLCFIDSILNFKNVVFSRSPIDSLAYGKLLNCAPFMYETMQRQIDITKKDIHYLYIPVEFDMIEDDVVRGNNRGIQLKTDELIRDLIQNSEVNFTQISGNLIERCDKLDIILNKYRRS